MDRYIDGKYRTSVSTKVNSNSTGFFWCKEISSDDSLMNHSAYKGYYIYVKGDLLTML